MKTKSTILAALLFISVSLSAQTLTKTERKVVNTYLKEITGKVGALQKKYGNQQLTFKPSDNVWSIREIAEHLVKTDSLYINIINGALQNEPKAGTKTSQTDDKIVSVVIDRVSQSGRLQAPSMIRPQNDFPDFATAYNALKKSRKGIIKYLKKTDDPLRSHFSGHPLFGTIDLYQWYLMAGSHTERHYLQMLEVTESEDFPEE